ncbi:MAG TPA: 2-hydroxychromene-2-carboxylate isomerase [Burkholderiaceae bacterium]|jgi:2-hydroxychromene-2-carboxylate isomerase|nr:2-hydroxychromene-2-carboxylate isomerase [Burkholderiaceae bacterium]
MAKTVDFYFDFGSPAAYLAYTQLPRLASETGATIVMKPILLGGVFQASGNRPPASVPLKGSYLFKDMSRFARRYGVRLIMNPFFPIITTTLMRMDLGLHRRNDPSLKHFRDTVFQGIWVDERNLNDPVTVGAVLTEAGFDPTALLALASEQTIKDELKTVTLAAVERGVFGAPTFFVGNEMFWGQDRLDFVRDALTN